MYVHLSNPIPGLHLVNYTSRKLTMCTCSQLACHATDVSVPFESALGLATPVCTQGQNITLKHYQYLPIILCIVVYETSIQMWTLVVIGVSWVLLLLVVISNCICCFCYCILKGNKINYNYKMMLFVCCHLIIHSLYPAKRMK